MKVYSKQLYAPGTLYNEYVVFVNDKAYDVKGILFYDKDGVVVEEGGYLRKADHSLVPIIELPTETIKLRRKLRFDGEVFIMGERTSWGDWHARLYIPYEMLGIRFVKYEIDKVNRQAVSIYEGTGGIYIKAPKKYLGDKLDTFRHEYEDIHRRLYFVRTLNADKVREDAERLMDLAVCYEEEKKRIDSLTIEDLELD